MVFSSVLFIFLFLPIVLTLYFVSPRPLRNLWLLFASLFFYAWGETFYVGVMLASILLNYSFGLLIDRGRGKAYAKIALAGGVVSNLAVLIFFKYANFLTDNLASLAAMAGLPAPELAAVHLPIGISFFTFQGMSYAIDVYRGDAQVQRNPLNVALYISLFPQLIAGPIVRFHDVAQQIAHRTLTLARMNYGAQRFIVGLAKKVLLANTVAVPADAIFSIPTADLTPGLAWLGIVCYALQIYFDFSGYSDMAIGLGHMFGFHFLENFQWPYVSQSIREFWRRWHISLSTWFRDYLYVPLGGSRASTFRTYLNLVLVFFLCGLWHGASWSFVVWGFYHGFFLVLERSPVGRVLDRLWRPMRHAYTLFVVLIGWVFFRAEELSYALGYLSAMFTPGMGNSLLHPVMKYLQNDVLLAIVLGGIGSTPIMPWIAKHIWTSEDQEHSFSSAQPLLQNLFLSVVCMTLFALCAMSLSAGTHNPFIYFRF